MCAIQNLYAMLIFHAGISLGTQKSNYFDSGISINSSPLDKMAAITQTIFSDAIEWTPNEKYVADFR